MVINHDKELYKTIKGYLSGIGTFAASYLFVHEGGHYIGAKIVGGNPEIIFNPDGIVIKPNFDYSSLEEYIRKGMIVKIGAPILEYSVAIATLLIGRKLDRNNHRILKAGMKAFSSMLSWFPFAYSVYSFLTKIGDYQSLDNLGVSYNITIPVTFLLGSLITYLNFSEKYPKLDDYIDDTQREGIREHFIRALKYEGKKPKEYKPTFLSKIKARIKGKSPIEVRADELCKSLFSSEVFSQEDAIETIREYLPKVE